MPILASLAEAPEAPEAPAEWWNLLLLDMAMEGRKSGRTTVTEALGAEATVQRGKLF